MLRLTLNAGVLGVPPKDYGTRPQPSQAEQSRFVSLFQQEFQSPEYRLEVKIDTGNTGIVRADVSRHGKAAAAIWSEPSDTAGRFRPFAVSVALFGQDGADDAAAIESLKKANPPLPFEEPIYRKMMAAGRPCVVAYFINEIGERWFETGVADSLMMALAVANAAGPKSQPKLRFEEEPTPEELVRMQERVDRILEVFKLIQHRSTREGKFIYVVRPDRPIKDKPVQDILDVKFWVGISDTQGDNLDIEELTALFVFYTEQLEQMKGMKYMKEPKSSGTLNLAPSPAVIEAVLKQLTVTEPD